MMRKGQSAVEYLSVYAIAFMIVLIVIAAVYYLWTGNTPTTPYCDVSTDITCVDFYINTTGNLSLMVRQTTGHSINVTGINCTSEENAAQITKSTNVMVSDGEQGMIVSGQPCYKSGGSVAVGNVGGYYNGKLFVKYVESDTNMSHSVIGRITVRYE